MADKRFAKLRAALAGVPVTQSVMPITPGSVATLAGRAGRVAERVGDRAAFQAALKRLALKDKAARASSQSPFEAEFGMSRVLNTLKQAAKAR